MRTVTENSIRLILAGFIISVMISGCGAGSKAENFGKEEPSGESPVAREAEIKAEAPAEAAEDKENLFLQYLKDEIRFQGEVFSDRYSFVKEDFDQDPESYLFDVDEDGKDELLDQGCNELIRQTNQTVPRLQIYV